MDEFKIIECLNKILILSFEERNNLYFKIKKTIEDSNSDEASRTILSKIVDILAESKNKIESVVLSGGQNDSSSEGKEFNGSFRRVPS